MTSLRHLDGLPVVVGAGLAGLMAALSLAPHPVILLSKGSLGVGTASALAQGGVAASVGEDDAPHLHLADTLQAGDGLCDASAAGRIVDAGPATIDMLARHGVRFDRGENGALLRGLEAAHSRHRIVHAAGDATGAEIVRALVEAVRATPSIIVLEHAEARRLFVKDNAVCGIAVAGPKGMTTLATERIVIATGGVGGLFLETTNPSGSFGQGLALAALAGAELADMEFVQFHPTALDVAAYPLKLVSEAVRGEGALLVDERGHRFMADIPGAELAPRDIVARAVWQHISKGHKVFLNARQALGQRFASRFPGITAICRDAGFDPATTLIPIRPAAHYHMGGIKVDAAGRSSVKGLWACGEAACTGLHGANRLASNSLLEAASCAAWVAQDVANMPTRGNIQRAPSVIPNPLKADPAELRQILSRCVGVIRNGDGLREAILLLLPFVESSCAASTPALVGLMMAVSALKRNESRGAHFRTDFPQTDAMAQRSIVKLDETLAFARELAAPRRTLARRA